MFTLQNAFAIFQNVCNWLFLAHVCSPRCNSISTCVFPSFHLHPTNTSDSKFSFIYTFLSPHSWFSLVFAHSPLCILLCALCSKVLDALVLIVQKCSLKQKEGTQKKTFAQVSSMGRLTQHETTFIPSSWRKTNFDPLFKPFVFSWCCVWSYDL